MREESGSIFEYKADAIVIPTNLQVKRGDRAVMGAGVALEAAQRWPILPDLLGMRIAYHGRHTYAVWPDPNGRPLVCFPTKHHYREPADLDLIGQSAAEMVGIADLWKWRTVVLPRLGCGLGGLDWETQVRPLLSGILDDRFIVLHQGEGA